MAIKKRTSAGGQILTQKIYIARYKKMCDEKIELPKILKMKKIHENRDVQQSAGDAVSMEQLFNVRRRSK